MWIKCHENIYFSLRDDIYHGKKIVFIQHILCTRPYACNFIEWHYNSYLTNTGVTKCHKAEKWNKLTLLKKNRHHSANVNIMFKNMKVIRYPLNFKKVYSTNNCWAPTLYQTGLLIVYMYTFKNKIKNLLWQKYFFKNLTMSAFVINIFFLSYLNKCQLYLYIPIQEVLSENQSWEKIIFKQKR